MTRSRIRASVWGVLGSLLLLCVGACQSAGSDPTAAGNHNPLLNGATGMPLSCPDPSVDAHDAPHTYVLVCSSSTSPDAFPLYTSSDLVRWRPSGFVFPRGRQPSWAVKATGSVHAGRFWAPDIHWLYGSWVVYFAANYNAHTVELRLHDSRRVAPGSFVIGVATAPTLGGPWRTRVLHYRGQFNGVGGQPESVGGGVGSIDPSVLVDPGNGRRYLYWADQRTEIWAGTLTPDGLSLDPDVRMVLNQSEPWECDPARRRCWVEAPAPFYRNGQVQLLYSGGSTWDATYCVGVAVSQNPLSGFHKVTHPVLRSGDGFVGPGGASAPVVGPDGQTYVIYHALRRPSMRSSDRLLMRDRLTWVGSQAQIGDGFPG